jgi:nitronate monooxygenase
MAGSSGVALAVAAAGAGALGALPCAMLSVEAIRAAAAAFRAAAKVPLHLNFFCHETPAHDPAREAAWLGLLKPYYDELSVAPGGAGGPARRPFDESACALVEELRPEVVSFHFGLPPPALADRARQAGAFLMASATSPAEAHFLEARGVDAIIAQSAEAGGHQGLFLRSDIRGQLGLAARLPQLRAQTGLPILAAGGVVDARTVAAAKALGADGVLVGTAFLRCPESEASAVHRAALASDAACDTMFTNLFSGRPARGIVNRLMRELGPVRGDIPAFPLASPALAPLRAKAEAAGRGDF